MSDTTPAPVPPPIVLTRTMRVSRALWFLSFVAGVVVLAAAFLNRQLQLGNLRTLVQESAPERAESTVDAVANVLFWGTLGALTAVILFQIILLRTMLNRRGAARLGLAALILLDLVVAVVAATFLAEPGIEGVVFTSFLIAQVALAVLALAVSFLPGAHRFFRSGRQARRPSAV